MRLATGGTAIALSLGQEVMMTGLTRLALLVATNVLLLGCLGELAGIDDSEREPSARLKDRELLDQPQPQPSLRLGDELRFQLMPWLAQPVKPKPPSLSKSSASIPDLVPVPVPSGLYLTGAVTGITGPTSRTISRLGQVRLYEGTLVTTPGKTRTVRVAIDARKLFEPDNPDLQLRYTADDEVHIVLQIFRSWASLPPEIRDHPENPTAWVIDTQYPYSATPGTLPEFGSVAVWSRFVRGWFEDNPATGVSGSLFVSWHEGAGHTVADSYPSTWSAPVPGEPYMSLYSHRAVLGWQAREINGDRMTAIVASLYADAYRSDPTAAEPATVPRKVIKCGFPKNLAVMVAAMPWLDGYFKDIDCSSYQHPVKVINGHFAAPNAPNSVEIYGDSGQRVTCLVNHAGLETPAQPGISDTSLVVAQRLPDGMLVCSAVCPNGTVQDIYGYYGNQRRCIPVGDCFKLSQGSHWSANYVFWYNAIQDFCEFANRSDGDGFHRGRPTRRCRMLFGGESAIHHQTLGASGVEEERCVSKMHCQQSWAPPTLIGYGGSIEGDQCKNAMSD